MGKLDEILDGWGNLIKSNFGLLDEETRKMAEKRLIHCNVCILRIGNICNPLQRINHIKTNELITGCGCNISAKTLSPQSKCPAGKW